jgi:hypothetical protein
MKPTKQTRPLPSRGGLNDLGKTQRTIVDYAKVTPGNVTTPNPAEIRVLQIPKGKR